MDIGDYDILMTVIAIGRTFVLDKRKECREGNDREEFKEEGGGLQ